MEAREAQKVAGRFRNPDVGARERRKGQTAPVADPLNPAEPPRLFSELIARTVSGRLRDASQEEKRSVALYVASFMKRK